MSGGPRTGNSIHTATTLPPCPRIVVIGSSSAGKTTLAIALSQALAVPRIEMDELFWSPAWRPNPTQVFASDTAAWLEGLRHAE